MTVFSLVKPLLKESARYAPASVVTTCASAISALTVVLLPLEEPPEDEPPLDEPPPEAVLPTVSALPAETALSPALTPETLSAAVTLVPVVVTVTLLAFAFTVPTLPAPVIFAPSALTLMEPTDAPLFTVMAELCATVMLSTEPETAMSVLAIMPLLALVSLKVTPLSRLSVS